MRRQSISSHSKLQSLLTSTALLSSVIISQVNAATDFSFFEHSSCNVGTAFYQLSDPNPLTSDLNCHQIPAGSVAIYISGIDDGCTLRTYNTPNCKPSSISGLLLGAGTCFYADSHDAVMGSWRADCMGVDYSDSNGDDHGNSYSTSTDDGGAGGGGGEGDTDAAFVAAILATATGPVTVSETQTQSSNEQVTRTVVPIQGTASSESDSSTATASASATTTALDSVANDAGSRPCQRKRLALGMASSLGLVFAVAAFWG